MFFEVCLLSLGLFAGSELYKKIGSSFGEQPHNCGLRKKQEHLRSSEVNRKSGRGESSFDPERAEVSAALESLTQEVSRLREDFADYLAANKVNSVKNNEVPPTRRPVSGASIFEKLIEENVTLRKG